jgi:hypothetical protein
MEVLSLLLTALLVGFWLFTLHRIYTGEYAGRYTKRRWLVSIWTMWGMLAYWAVGDAQRQVK